MIKFQGFSAGAAVTGGLTYKGTFDASAGTPDISNALQGDLYVIDVAGTIYGQTWAINDHLLVNADMGGVISNSKIDKVDNTSDTALQIANNLSDLNNASTARTNLGLGTAAIEDTGTAVGDVPLLEDVGGGVAGLPAVDGSQLTGITAAGSLLVANNLSDLSNVTTARSNLGLGTAATTASTDYLAVANDLSDLNNVTTARSNLGLGTAATTASTDYLAVANNLSDLNNATTARTNLGLGTAAIEDTGTGVGDIPILIDVGGGVAGFSAIDGSNLTGITASGALLAANNLSDLNDAATARSNLGLGTAAVQDVGTTAGDIVQLDGAAKIPAVDGSQLTNLPFTGLDVSTVTGAAINANINQAHWITTLGATSVTLTLPISSGVVDGDTVVATRIRSGELVIAQNGGDAGTLVNYGTTQASSVTLQNNYQMLTIRWNGSAWYIFDQATGTAANEDVGTTAGDVVQLDGTGKLPAVDGSQLTNLPSAPVTSVNGNTGVVTVDVLDDTSPQLGGDLDVNGQSIVSVSNGDIDIAPNGTGVIKTTGSIEPDADLTRTIGTEALRYLTAYTDIDGAIRFKAKNDSGGLMTKGQVVYISGISGSIPTVDLARSNSASTMPAFGLVHANANDQAEVTIITLGSLYDVDTTTYSLSVGDTVYVSSATAGALTNSPPTGESNLIQNIGKVVRADASAGIIKVGGSGRSAATPNLDTDKVFLGDGSNQAVSTALSAINLSSFNQDLTTTNVSEGTNQYFTTGRVDTQVSTLPMSTLSDVAYTAGAGIDNYVLTYDHSSTSWGAEPSAGGGAAWTYNAITSASSPVTSAVSNHYGADTSGGVITFNLPALSGLSGGEEIRIKLNTAGNNLNVTPNGADTIDGSATAYVLSVALSSITLVASSGTNWEII